MGCSSTDHVKSTTFDIDTVLGQLTLDEKIRLLSLKDVWNVHGVERLGINSARLSDGPNGVRGTTYFRGFRAACLPCGTGLSSTWNKPLLEAAGRLLAREAHHKSAHAILGPTCNIQRAPNGGRGFESFSEDPILSGSCVVPLVRGIQQGGISVVLKHFVCNDMEDERRMVDVVVSERALREVYLMPFMMAAKDADLRAIMTSYNSVNGTHMSENRKLLSDILRDDWKWDGLLISDWFGTYSSKGSLEAGLDIECPGPAVIRRYDTLHQQIGCREVSKPLIDLHVRRILQFLQHTQETGIPEDGPEDEANNTPDTRMLLKELADKSIVLLKNDNDMLPLNREDDVCLIGPSAKVPRTSGGGSASLNPYYETDVYSSVSKIIGYDPEYCAGSILDRSLEDVGKFCTHQGQPGFHFNVFKDEARTELIDEFMLDTSQLLMIDYDPTGTFLFYMDMEADFTPERTGEYTFIERCLGTTIVRIDGEIVIDDKTAQQLGHSNMGSISETVTGTMSLEAGKTYKVNIEFGSAPTFTAKDSDVSALYSGGSIYLTFKYNYEPNQLIQEAVELAGKHDKVIMCIGTTPQYECEDFDRPNMDLPGDQTQLVAAVLQANRNTIVVNQSGTPVTLPWMDQIPAFIQAWFGGCEGGNAIADVLYGLVNPSAKLPLTFPKRIEDNPAYLTFQSDLGTCVYGEGVFVGYRYYEKVQREPLFPFGFGLSYTTFELDDLQVSGDINVTVQVTNTGTRSGSETIQLYISPPTVAHVQRPIKELKGFAKVELQPAETKQVTISVPYKQACSYYNTDYCKWSVNKGEYGIIIGTSSTGPFLKSVYSVSDTEYWDGLQ